MAQLETEQTEKILSEDISNTESLTDPSNQNEDIIEKDITGADISINEVDASKQMTSGEDTGTTNQTGEDIINQEETLEDNGTTGENNGTTGEDIDNIENNISNTESLTESSNQNNATSSYTPDEIIEMTKQTSDETSASDQAISASSPIIYIPKTLILGQDGSCDYIVQADTSTLQTNQEIQVIPSETFEMTNIHNENLKYIGTTSQDKNIITSSEPLIQGNLRCNIKRPGSYKGTVQFDISIKSSDITN